MHIIYLTTALREDDYAELLSMCHYASNPSNQNFHLNLIQGLNEVTEVETVSLRPFHYSLKKVFYYPQATIENFHYLGFINMPILKPLSAISQGVKIVLSLLRKDSVIVVDSLNLTLAYLVKSLKKKNAVPVYALVTDLAENMSSVKPSYVKKMGKTFAQYDGFLCLTEGLNAKVNRRQKPYYIFHGLVKVDPQEVEVPYKPTGKYFFFAGALYRRYGIISLLEAFALVQGDYHLLIAGQGPDVSYVLEAMETDPRIHYLGVLPYDIVLSYEKHALANINPRLFDPELDQYSIPSKLLEYLASGRPTITTNNTLLNKQFGAYVIRANEGETVEIAEAMMEVLKDESGYVLAAKEGQKKLIELYDRKIVARKIVDYLINSCKASSTR